MNARRLPLPARITLALILVLIISAWNVVRLRAGLEMWTVLEEYAGAPGPAYVVATGGLWGGLGLILVWAVWRRRSWAPRALMLGAAVYAVWHWADRILLQPNLDPGWGFSVVMTLLQLAIIGAAALDPRNRHYFGREAHEREEQDRTTA